MDNGYGLVIDGLNITFAGIGTAVKSEILKAVRPNNIGKSTWSQLVKSELDDAEKLFGSSADDVVRGFANVKVTGVLPKILNKLGYVGAALGGYAGTIVPGAGNVIGALAGFGVGIGIYLATDVLKIKGKSVRKHLKDGISKLFNW